MTDHTDELARFLTRRTRTPAQLTGSTTPGGDSISTAIWTLPKAIGDVGDVLSVVLNGDLDTVPGWVPGWVPGPPRTITTSDTATVSERTILVNATGGAVVLTLPSAVSGSGPLTVKKIDASANAVTVTPAGAETIDGASSYAVVSQWQAVTLVSDGSAWFVVGEVS